LRVAAARRSSPQLAAARRSSPQLAAARRSSPQLAAARRCRLFDRALQRACAMWSANADCACWLGMLAAGGLLVVVGLLLLVAQNFGGLVFVYLSVISVLSQFLSQCDLSFYLSFYLSLISVLRRRYFRAFRSYLTPNSR
jgi:hypothetical protein